MRIVVIGATGTIGREVVRALSGRHEVLEVSRKGGSYQADITSKESLERLFKAVAPFDALVSATPRSRCRARRPSAW
ncbi:NAD-dependent epimerase/dehydratase family protein [Archangium sp.]|uniref:NAD-dependent epimerase/dehydratase family protein n=1 Tax=Archangium sp. TaxID=1872627 RepID=UPI00389AF033